MRRGGVCIGLVVVLMLVYAASTPVRAQAVPQSIAFSAQLEDGGMPMTGAHDLVFSLWSTPSGGLMPLWQEAHAGVTVTDGFVEAQLGTPASIFAGAALYLEIEVDGQVLSPRIEVASVPYALRAGAVGPYAPGDLQERVDGVCGGGFAMTAVGTDGSVTCSPVVSSIIAGPGLVGGGSAETVLAMMDCPAGAHPVDQGGPGSINYVCQAAGDIFEVATPFGGGLTGGATSGAPSLAMLDCPAGHAPIDIGGLGTRNYVCSPAPVGDITSVTAVASGGLATSGAGTQGDVALSLTPCPSGMVLKAGAPGTGYSCQQDADSAAVKESADVSYVGVRINDQVVSVSTNPAQGGYMHITMQGTMDSFGALRASCTLSDGGFAIDSFMWEAGDADAETDLSQSRTTVQLVSAGVHSYSLVCSALPVPGPVTTLFISDPKIILLFVPKSLP